MGDSDGLELQRLARSIYTAFKIGKRRNYLIPEDFFDAYATPEEAREAFRVFDKNNDGFISTIDLRNILTTLGENFTDEQIEQMLKEADSDNDGKVNSKN